MSIYSNMLRLRSASLSRRTFMGNIVPGGTVAVDPSTMGKVKSKYRDEEDE